MTDDQHWAYTDDAPHDISKPMEKEIGGEEIGNRGSRSGSPLGPYFLPPAAPISSSEGMGAAVWLVASALLAGLALGATWLHHAVSHGWWLP